MAVSRIPGACRGRGADRPEPVGVVDDPHVAVDRSVHGFLDLLQGVGAGFEPGLNRIGQGLIQNGGLSRNTARQ